MDKDFIIETLKKLININTINPPGNEKMLAEFIKRILDGIGIYSEVSLIEGNRANLTGILGCNNGTVLVLNGHLDTIPVMGRWDYDPFGGKVDGGKVYGLGSADMKGAIAAMIGAVKKIKESSDNLKGMLLLSFVADEEKNNLGTIDFLKSFKKINYAIIGEPTNLNIVVSNRGVLRLKITTHGISGHCSNPRSGINAIYKMIGIIEKLREYAHTIDSINSDYSHKPSMSINMINGGTAENTIPDICEIVLDRRLTYREDKNEVEREIINILEDFKEKDKEFKYSYKKIVKMDPWKVDENLEFLKYCKKAFINCFSKDPVFRDLGGTSEAALFAKKGIDTVIFGPGDIKMAHSKNEYVNINKVLEAARYYYFLIKEILVK